MPTVDEFWRIAAQVATERGGLVVGFTRDSDQPELGSMLDNVFGFATQSPVTVVSLSDWADWIEQVEAFYRLKPDWGRAKRGTADANYYRVKFDGKFKEKFEGKFAEKFADKFDVGAPQTSPSSTTFGTSPPSPGPSAFHLLLGMPNRASGFSVCHSGLAAWLASPTIWFTASSHSWPDSCSFCYCRLPPEAALRLGF